MRLIISVLFATACLGTPLEPFTFGPLVEPGLLPNVNVQLPHELLNESGLTTDQLIGQFPQNVFAFSYGLVAYFDVVRPWAPAQWTIRAPQGVPDYIQPSTFIPSDPIIVPPIVIPPDGEPPTEEPSPVPEPATMVLVGSGILSAFLFKRRR